MSVEVESPLKISAHQPIMLQGQTTGIGVEPIPLQRILLNDSYASLGYLSQDRFTGESDDAGSSSPSPRPSHREVAYLELNVKSEPDDNGGLTKPTYRLLQPSGILDATQILQSHGLFEANQAASNYPPASGVATVLLSSEANIQNSFTHSRSIAGMGELPPALSIYSPHTNGHLAQLPNSASSDSCSPDLNSQKAFMYTKPPTSPSPYTANTERARAFNAYVKQLIESRMDCKVPISLQPKHLVDDIMNDAKKHFPEFESCTRKRIRTFLKSCRRSKKFKQQIGDDYMKRADSGLSMSPALGSSPDLAQIRSQLVSSGQTLIIPQFINQAPNSSPLMRHARPVIPQPVASLGPISSHKVPTIPIAQHLPHFNVDAISDGNISPTNSEPLEFGNQLNRKYSDSDDDEMNTGNNSDPDNASTRPSTPHTLPHGSNTGSIHAGIQLAQLPNSQGLIPTAFLQRPLNGTPTLQQIPIHSHLLASQGQIMHTQSESHNKLTQVALAQVNQHNRKRPSPTIEESQSKKLNGDVRNSILRTLSCVSPYPSIANSALTGNIGEYPNFPNGVTKLSKSEVQEIQKMIDGYRLSATFLDRAASQLEKFIQNESSKLF